MLVELYPVDRRTSGREFGVQGLERRVVGGRGDGYRLGAFIWLGRFEDDPLGDEQGFRGRMLCFSLRSALWRRRS